MWIEWSSTMYSPGFQLGTGYAPPTGS